MFGVGSFVQWSERWIVAIEVGFGMMEFDGRCVGLVEIVESDEMVIVVK